MDELRSYDPTVRDKIARLLMGNERAGTARSDLVQGVMGSRGMGSTGMGLVDLTPAGIPLGAQEGYNQDGAIGAAAAMVPGYNAEGKVLKAITQKAVRSYMKAPDSLMGFRRSGQNVGFHESNYPFTQKVKIHFDDGEVMEDAIKGMNSPHALERAYRNWPTAKKIEVTE